MITRLKPQRLKLAKCPQCGRRIIVARVEEGTVYSEYVGKGGLCWDCSKRK